MSSCGVHHFPIVWQLRGVLDAFRWCLDSNSSFVSSSVVPHLILPQRAREFHNVMHDCRVFMSSLPSQSAVNARQDHLTAALCRRKSPQHPIRLWECHQTCFFFHMVAELSI